MRHLTLHLKLILLAACLFILQGCATDQDTDMPWNTPKQWEGSPTIPGMPNYQ
jgi:uncharacterized lipoprotein YajG